MGNIHIGDLGPTPNPNVNVPSLSLESIAWLRKSKIPLVSPEEYSLIADFSLVWYLVAIENPHGLSTWQKLRGL